MNGSVALARVETPISVDALDRDIYLLESARQSAWINDIVIGDDSRDDLLRVGIH